VGHGTEGKKVKINRSISLRTSLSTQPTSLHHHYIIIASFLVLLNRIKTTTRTNETKTGKILYDDIFAGWSWLGTVRYLVVNAEDLARYYNVSDSDIVIIMLKNTNHADRSTGPGGMQIPLGLWLQIKHDLTH
jgi:hypothetical protein